jgi:dihydroxyacid dehydratase/phosphogluconate dehydratase
MIPAVLTHCAGIDIGKRGVAVCLMIGAAEAEPKVEVREFSTFTADIEAMKAWLVQAGCTHVVMESTGSYWKPVFNVLEDRLVVCLAKNAMALDIAMGGSTNTVLHLLAAAQEGGVPFTMHDIDRLSRKVPHICKVAPSSQTAHVEDVHRAGGVFAILGELDRAGLLNRDVYTVHSPTLGDAIERWDVTRTQDSAVHDFYRAAPGGVRTTEPFSQSARNPDIDLDRSKGAIRDVEHAFSPDGGLAVLYGNIAKEGCIVKTAGVDASNLVFSGPAHIFDSQD